MYANFRGSTHLCTIFKRRRRNFPYNIYINFKRPFLTKLTHLCTQFQKLDPPMYAHFGFQNPPILDHHGIQDFIGVLSPGILYLKTHPCFIIIPVSPNIKYPRELSSLESCQSFVMCDLKRLLTTKYLNI